MRPARIARPLALLLVAAPALRAQTPAEQPAAPPALRLAPHAVHDPMVNGVEAFRLLVPSGWKVEGGVVWRQQYSNLASASLRLTNPDAPERLEFFPVTPYAWVEGGMWGAQPGQIYMGNELRPTITDPQRFVQEVVWPSFRRGVSARIVGVEEMPELARLVAQQNGGQGVQAEARSARVRLEYREGSRTMQEDVYVTLGFYSSPMMPGSVIWKAERLFAFAAEKGRIDERKDLVQAIVNSVRLSPQWFAGYMQVFELWQKGQYQAIADAGRISRQISRNNDEILAMYHSAWEQQQKSQDAVADSWSRYMRGEERYEDPYKGDSIALPSGYDDAWVSSSGEYLLSNQAGFDPNVGSTIEWRRMEVTPAGR